MSRGVDTYTILTICKFGGLALTGAAGILSAATRTSQDKPGRQRPDGTIGPPRKQLTRWGASMVVCNLLGLGCALGAQIAETIKRSADAEVARASEAGRRAVADQQLALATNAVDMQRGLATKFETIRIESLVLRLESDSDAVKALRADFARLAAQDPKTLPRGWPVRRENGGTISVRLAASDLDRATAALPAFGPLRGLVDNLSGPFLALRRDAKAILGPGNDWMGFDQQDPPDFFAATRAPKDSAPWLWFDPSNGAIDFHVGPFETPPKRPMFGFDNASIVGAWNLGGARMGLLFCLDANGNRELTPLLQSLHALHAQVTAGAFHFAAVDFTLHSEERPTHVAALPTSLLLCFDTVLPSSDDIVNGRADRPFTPPR